MKPLEAALSAIREMPSGHHVVMSDVEVGILAFLNTVDQELIAETLWTIQGWPDEPRYSWFEELIEIQDDYRDQVRVVIEDLKEMI